MSEMFKKVDREFCLTDESVNVYGYRLLTSGYLLDDFKKNPIGFLMHKRDEGVLVRWEDFRIDGQEVYAKPIINLSHPRGEQTLQEVENGFLNAVSVGKIVCLEATDDPAYMLPGQTGPTVTKWFNRELSFVDIPGNYNALGELYDINDNVLNLSDLSDLQKIKTPNTMKKIVLTALMLQNLSLKDDATDQEADKAFQDLVDKANKVDGLEKDLADQTEKLKVATTEIDTLKKESVKKEVSDLIAKGKEDKKLTNELAATLEKDYENNPTGLKNLLDNMPAQKLITDDLNDTNVSKYQGKTWDDLYASDELETVRNQFPDLYEKLKNEKYPKQK